MQTPKARSGSSEVPQRKSPATPRTARQLKIPASDLDSTSSSPNPGSKTPKDKTPKVADRRSPRSPVIEKKRPGRVSELESQLAQLQEELKKTKDQLNTSESWKRRAQQEAEDTKKQLETMSAKLEDSEQQLTELSASEDDRIQELRKISHDRDKAWQSELEAVQKHHSMDSAALASAINEIQKLKNQLEMAVESEAAQSKHAESAHSELQSLRMELTETMSLVEKLKSEINNCRESEAQALELVSETRKQLETADTTAEMLQSDGSKAMEAYNCISLELEESREKVKSLEELVRKLQESSTIDAGKNSVKPASETGDESETDQLKSLKCEVGQLRSALEASETRYQEEYIQSTLQIRSAYEQVEKLKSESGKREAELEAELMKAKSNINELRANLMDKETELQSISEENEGLNLEMEKSQPNEKESELETEMKKLKHDFAELKASMIDKETQLRNANEQNTMLKMEIEKGELERTKVNDGAVSLAETAKAAEQDALIKLGHITEEADRSSRRAARVTEQLDAAQAANSEMEAELRRLKVQSDQWRKAAEAAAAMLSTGNNGKVVERTGSLDNSYNTIGGALGSPYSEDMDDESPKKKNMLKKIGVLWKKGQK
ncbi:Interactor of constitutive active ROPs 3 [Euphorbia peplus]|nr:Interactor of constitutive active ROPs 3 [Euphorbia peplus]